MRVRIHSGTGFQETVHRAAARLSRAETSAGFSQTDAFAFRGLCAAAAILSRRGL